LKKGKSKNHKVGIDEQEPDEKRPNGRHYGRNSSSGNFKQDYGYWISNTMDSDPRRYRWDPEFGAKVAFIGRNNMPVYLDETGYYQHKNGSSTQRVEYIPNESEIVALEKDEPNAEASGRRNCTRSRRFGPRPVFVGRDNNLVY
jgi:hypothetical protein